MTREHREAILDQFTRQAVPFSTAPTIRDEQALALLVKASGAGPDDTVLESLLARSFPQPGDADTIREMFHAALEDDNMGIPVHEEESWPTG